VKIQPIAWGIVRFVNQLVPVPVQLKSPARVANVKAALSLAVEVVMIPAPKSVSAPLALFVTFLFCLKELLIF
jgi:hypothetical protein